MCVTKSCMNVQSKGETSAHALHDTLAARTETLAERRAEWCREFQWQCGGKTRHMHANTHAHTHAPSLKICLVTVLYPSKPPPPLPPHSSCVVVVVRILGQKGSKSSKKEASHWFHAISNSYLAHLTSIK